MKPYNEEQSKKEQVEEMFDNIAPTYDRLNHIMSLNIDKIWRRRVMRIVRRHKARKIMDVATGTGDLAIAMAKRVDRTQILGVDLSEEMLAVARKKIQKQGLEERIMLEKGDAENLAMVSSESLDAATVAFGVRNFENIERGLSEIYRTLRVGGLLVVLEFSMPKNRLIRWVYSQYAHRLLPRIGGMISKDKRAYTYLPDSVEEFPAPERFAEILKGVGFKSVKLRSQSFGIAYIYIATK
ncbi:MAG: bifunctional demethylmenaquinone methyltransferase/2-methoxy-6-polyprenyl-1,4-benzoquinol methylase UbiE [Alistipes sp.]|nr:bifunctional demethylmenaquinone methyltransferase/2-methoxy-6-polyprenyl-1,4-benzoquinol methylase UbiE [Alistipes sp.]MBR5584753.1 bifunctional demethylmenaquinone methyltransferase/2-methoxy-6-polyprenyl-1,4-benzoquinol methylase UbiE [Alistipes sp.]MBR6544798.1 bifunctional demethylmenaquinone methyltransferase/2-methoxy-6-polyprenyl-1,4-benzoquinol methylase UbiE [Alistipes sp.]